MSTPCVSAVIPTHNRPHLVTRAVRSALVQTLEAIEVIVVVDGPDTATLQALREVDDPRLQVKTLNCNVGAADARNAGVKLARAPWIAFLDDDDEWLPLKLELQLQTAQHSTLPTPIVSCRFQVLVGSAQFIWPRRVPRPGEHVSEYLFCRTSPFFGEGILPASALFVSRSLLQTVPFTSGLRHLEDVDWLLRAAAVQGVGVEFVPTSEPLMIWHRRTQRDPGKASGQWRDILAWARSNRHLMTRRAYAAMLLTWSSTGPIRQRQTEAFWPLLREALRTGSPAPMDILTYLAYWLVPQRVQRYAAALAARRAPVGRQDGKQP